MAYEYEEIPDGDLQPYPKINDNNQSLGQPWTFARVVGLTSGLVVRIGGGDYLAAAVAGADLTATDNTTNYIVALRATGALSISTATTNWTDAAYGRVGKAVFASGVLTYYDARFEAAGIFGPVTAGAGDVVGPASATDSHFAQFDGTTGKLVKGGLALDTDGTLAAASATRVPSQSAVKAYADALVAGLSWKQAVRAATTVSGTLATSFANASVIDGVTLATGDRILVKNQAAGAENGIYVVAASGAPTRATDADSGAELVNASVYVSEGTTLADTQWTCTTNAPITINTTALAFAPFTGGSGITALTGDVTASGPGSAAATIPNDTVTNAKAANMATATIKGRSTAGTGDPEDLTPAQAAAIVQGDGLTGGLAGFRNIPQNSQSAAYTTVAADSGKHLLHPTADTAARTFTIDSNATVAYPIGTAITFVNQSGAGVLTIAITTDTMRLAGAGTTGSRTLAANGVATAIKLTATEWIISGTGLT